MEERHRVLKVDAYDYRDNGMISILLDFVPDEVHKEITMKYATVGSNAIDLRTAILEVERIIEREKDRVQSRRDQQTKGKISALQEEVAEDLNVWNHETNSGYGGFVLVPKRVRQGEEDEKEAQPEVSVRGKVEQGQKRCSKGAVKLREVKVQEAKERRVASASLVAKKPPQGAVPVALVRAQDGLRKRGGIPYRLRRTKAKAKAKVKTEEKVAKVRKGQLLEFSITRDGGVGVLAIGVLGLYNYEQNNDHE